jgi:hypothetical protein
VVANFAVVVVLAEVEPVAVIKSGVVIHSVVVIDSVVESGVVVLVLVVVNRVGLVGIVVGVGGLVVYSHVMMLCWANLAFGILLQQTNFYHC